MRKILYLIIAFLFCAECDNGNQQNVENITVKSSKIQWKDRKYTVNVRFNKGRTEVLNKNIDINNLARHLYKQMHVVGNDIFNDGNQNISFEDFCKKCMQRLANHYETEQKKDKT